MKVKGRFDHFNINVTDLDKSIKFYETALGLHESHRKEASDGSFVLVYMADDHSNFLLELTWLRDLISSLTLWRLISVSRTRITYQMIFRKL